MKTYQALILTKWKDFSHLLFAYSAYLSKEYVVILLLLFILMDLKCKKSETNGYNTIRFDNMERILYRNFWQQQQQLTWISLGIKVYISTLPLSDEKSIVDEVLSFHFECFHKHQLCIHFPANIECMFIFMHGLDLNRIQFCGHIHRCIWFILTVHELI